MGPLHGVRVLEFAGVGPAPYCGMLLGDLGADVLRIERHADVDLGVSVSPQFDILSRNKRSIQIDLKSEQGRERARQLVSRAEILIEGFRPGVMERLGLGPEVCLGLNAKLVYGRATGWGQGGRRAQEAGHDINYIAVTGVLAAIGPERPGPFPPLNLVGDGGGGMLLALGTLAGLLAAKGSGRGQVVDAAMIDAASSLMGLFQAYYQAGQWSLGREQNIIDGGMPYYRTFETADGKFVAVGAIENRFFGEQLEILGIPTSEVSRRDPEGCQELTSRLQAAFATRTRDEWADVFSGTDACVSPVLDLSEVAREPHHVERGTYVEIDGVVQPAPAPRFSETRCELPKMTRAAERHPVEARDGWLAAEVEHRS